MAHKKKAPEPEEHGESAPLWIISFADLVTLLMSFFVILAAGRPQTAATDPDFAKVVAAIKAAFNNVPEASASADPNKDLAEILRKLKELMARSEGKAKKGGQGGARRQGDARGQGTDRGEGQANGQGDTPGMGDPSAKNEGLGPKEGRGQGEARGRGDSSEQGMYGRSFRVRRLRDGMEITAGGPVFFEPLSATLAPEGREQINILGQALKGHRNMVEVRGHALEEPRPENWSYQDAMKLSYDRAAGVASELIKAGIDPRGVRIVAVGPNEPLVRGVYDPAKAGDNRRVEIFIREALLDDYSGGSTPARD